MCLKSSVFIVFCFWIFKVNSQILDVEFSTGLNPMVHKNLNHNFYERIENLNDSQLNYYYLKSISGNRLELYLKVLVNKSSMSINSVDTLWDYFKEPVLTYNQGKSISIPENRFLFDEKKSKNYYLTSRTNNLNQTEIKLYYRSFHGNWKDSLMFTRILSNQVYIQPSLIYDDNLYLYTTNSDSGFVYRFDLSGSILASNYASSVNQGSNIFNWRYLQGPVNTLPLNDSIILFQTALINEVQMFDRFNLDTVGILKLNSVDQLSLFNNRKISPETSIDEFFLNDKLIMAGVATRLNHNTLDFTDQYYLMELDYDNNLIAFNSFGSDSIDQCCNSAYKLDSSYYLVGSFPCSNSLIAGNEFRKIFIVKSDGIKRDSIYLYGTSNHFPTKIFVNSDQDIFISSRVSNAWSDDSLSLQLTKISSDSLISVKNIKSKTTSINIHPNPTSDYLNSNSFEKGLDYLIFDMKGAIVSQNSIQEEGRINVSGLKTGSYFIKLIGNSGPSQRAGLFVIK